MPSLPLHSSTKLAVRVDPRGCFESNPVIDVVAVVDEDKNASLWRADDQLVVQHTVRGQAINVLRWREDGHALALGCGDGIVRLVSFENNKAVQRVRIGETERAHVGSVDFIAWSQILTGWRRHQEGILKNGRLHRAGHLDASTDVSSLPQQLAYLEVDTALPKMSPLPVSGGSGDDMFVFSTRASLEFVFRTFKSDDANVMDVMIVGTADGTIHLSICDSFVIGTFACSGTGYGPSRHPSFTPGPVPPQNASPFLLCGHASHPDVATHALLLQKGRAPVTSIYLVPMDLAFMSASPVNLALLSSKTTTLHSLLRYIEQTHSHLVAEWKSTRDIPSRYQLAVQDDLARVPKGPTNLVQALFHVATTGDIGGPVKEWLVDSLAERGHKRWDKAATEGLTNVRALIHENMLPALERAAIILSRLKGLASFHGPGDDIGFSPVQIMNLMDIVTGLTTVSHSMLVDVMDELDHFTVFSAWLRFLIDKLASGSSANDMEISEREATMDHAKVLTYIQNFLTSSPLGRYLDDSDPSDDERVWKRELKVACTPLLDLLTKSQRGSAEGANGKGVLPRVGFLVHHLMKEATVVFRSIASALKRGVRFGQATQISTGEPIGKQEIHMCSRLSGNQLDATMFTAIAPVGTTSQIYIFKTEIGIVRGISRTDPTTACPIALPPTHALVDFGFLDDKSLLVLSMNTMLSPRTLVLFRVSYQDPSRVAYVPHRAGNVPQRIVEGGVGAGEMDGRPGHVLDDAAVLQDDSSWLPRKMQVQQGSSLRGDIPARVCILGSDNTYRVFIVPRCWN